jgi:hypothetical protein
MDKKHWIIGTAMVAILLFTASAGHVALARGIRQSGHFAGGTFGPRAGLSTGFGGHHPGVNAASSGWRSPGQGVLGEGRHIEPAGHSPALGYLQGSASHPGLRGNRVPRGIAAEPHYYPGFGERHEAAEEHRGHGEHEAVRPRRQFGFGYVYPYYDYYGYGWPYAYPYTYPYSYYSLYSYPDGYDRWYTPESPGYAYPGNAYEYPYPEAYPNSPAGTESPAATAGATFYAEAKQAFRRGDYQEALRLGAHAAIEMPKDAGVHQLMSLAMFAEGDYRGAALEAHAALSLGPAPDWSTTYRYYGNAIANYTPQLRALEAFVREHPGEANAHFLLGYEYLMLGHPEAAKTQFATSATLAPQDELARRMIEQLGGAAQATTPQKPNPADR